MWRLGLLLWVGFCGSVLADQYRTFEGHGGPVMALELSDDGKRLLTGSFDYSVGLWTLEDGGVRWLEGHRAAVNAVSFIGPNRAASGGDDFEVILWDLGSQVMLRQLEGHQGKISAVAATADGMKLASASWDGSVRIWATETGEELAALDRHEGAVNDVIWSADGHRLFSAGQDGTIIEWDAATWTPRRTLVRHGFGVNRMVLDDDTGWLAYGAVDGGTRVLALASGAEIADMTLDRRPILALDRSPDGGYLAVGDGEGYIMVVSTNDWQIIQDFRATANGPIWALAFTPGGAGLVAAGIVDEVALWPLDQLDDATPLAGRQRAFQTDPATVSNGERQFLRKCSVCHTLDATGERRAGPALKGIFGRRAGGLEGYRYSDAMRRSEIVWSEETINRLFELGPDHYTPGSKMPMQRITSPRDRADLIAFLKAETGDD